MLDRQFGELLHKRGNHLLELTDGIPSLHVVKDNGTAHSDTEAYGNTEAYSNTETNGYIDAEAYSNTEADGYNKTDVHTEADRYTCKP